MMRVVMVLNRYPLPSQTFIRTQFDGLLAAGIDCHILDKAVVGSRAALSAGDDRVHRLAVRGVARPGPGLAAMAATSAIRCPRRSVAHLRALVRQGRSPFGSHWVTLDRLALLAPDVVHYAFASYALGDEHLPELLQSPMVVSCRGFDLTHVGGDDPATYRRLWRAASFVHFRSSDLLSIARERGFDDRRPHAVTPPGIDASYFSPPTDGDGERSRSGTSVLVSIGRLVEKKGHEVGLEAVSELRRRGWDLRYRIVGEGEREAELRDLANRLGLEDVVEFLGGLSSAGVREVLREADVLLHPSWHEGFGVAVLEAQAVEVPVVCSDAEGLAQNIEDGVSGFLTKRGDARAMAEHVDELLSRPDLARRMGRAGRDRIVSQFSVEKEIGSYLESYEQVMDR